MKKLFIIIFLWSFSFACHSQINNYFNYQGLLVDAIGDPLANTDLMATISITDGQVVAYSENHNIKTNQKGVFDIVIGTGDPIFSTFDQIEWLSYIPYIEMAYQISGSEEIKRLTPAKFYSVPFCLYSEKIVCQQGVPGIGKIGAQGFPGPAGPAGAPGAQGPRGVVGELKHSMLNQAPATDLENGLIYLDDGTNREDGKPGYRYYNQPNLEWVDL